MDKFNKSKIWKNKNVRRAIPLCVAILFYLIMTHLDLIGRGIAFLVNFILPVIVGIVLAYIMDPPIRNIEKKFSERGVNHARGKAIAIVIVIILVSLALLIIAVVPQVLSSVVKFATSKTSYHGALQQFVDNIAKRHVDMKSAFTAIDNMLDKMQSQVQDRLVSGSGSGGKHVLNFIIDFILAIYFLADKKRVQRNARNFFRLSMRDTTYVKVSSVWKRCDRIFIKFLFCEVIDALIVGCANAAFMLICQMSYVPMISVVVGLTNLVPTFGPIIGAVVGAFVLMMNNPIHALLFLAFTGILQALDGYMIKPKLYGDTLGVPGIWILIAVVIGGRVLGMWGMLLAIPIVAILDIVIRETLLPFMEERKIKREVRAAERAVHDSEEMDALELLMALQNDTQEKEE